jgi:formate-dependent nitrite reductase cytochrome c552 subunit
MHRLIINNNDSKMHTDHKNNNPLDNRRENLRICTNSQNQMNTKVQINNTSGFKGVVWNKIAKKWVAQIKLNNKLKNLGYYINIKDAARAYNAAAIKLHGEFAKLNEI